MVRIGNPNINTEYPSSWGWDQGQGLDREDIGALAKGLAKGLFP
jgi:hypothetical protein